MNKAIGKIEILSPGKGIAWRIEDFISATEGTLECDSPIFFLVDVTWRVRLCFWDVKPDNVELFLITNVERTYAAEYSFGLKKYDGSIEHLGSGLMKGSKICSNEGSYINKTKLQLQMSELMPNNVLTIICFIKMIEIRPDELMVNFNDLSSDKNICDGVLRLPDKKCKVQRSSFISLTNDFTAALMQNRLQIKMDFPTMSESDLHSFQECLEYINYDKFQELSFQSVLNLYNLCNKYSIEEFKEFCVTYLMHCLSVENLCELAVFADKNGEAQLFSIVQDFFNLKYVHIFLNSKWKILLRTDIELANKLLLEMAIRKLK